MFKAVSVVEDGWWNNSDSSSGSESSYSTTRSNNSSCPDWEEEVTPQGELFYVVRYPKPTQNKTENEPASNTSTISRKDNSDKPPTASGILVKLMRRKSSKRAVRQIEETTSGLTHSHQPSASKEGDTYSIRVGISGVVGWAKSNQTLIESKLGLITSSYKNKLIIESFSQQMNTFYQSTLTIGDWLYSIDGIVVTPDNIDSVLDSIITPKDVILKIKSLKNKKIAGSFLRKKSLLLGSNKQLSGRQSEIGQLGWLMYIVSEYNEVNIRYRFPSRCVSLPSPGAFLTTSHLLSTFTNSTVKSCTLCMNNEMVNVIYVEEGKDVLLVCLPTQRVTLDEAVYFTEELVTCIKFIFKSLARCFSSKEVSKVSVDEVVSNFLSRVSCRHPRDNTLETVQIQFDSILPGAHYIPLPKKIQVQLGDALNELESNDIKEFEGKRLYSVFGTCLIHKGYVVRNQCCDLIDIYSYIKCCQLLEIIREGVQDLVVWREVYPSSYRNSSKGAEPYTLQRNSRYFLLAVAQEHDMLIVIYESGGCTLRAQGKVGPDSIYVEEAQATLEHIQALAFHKYINKWFEMNDNLSQLERSKSTDSQLSDSKASIRSVRLGDCERYSFEYPPISGYQGGVRVRSWSLPSVSVQHSVDQLSCISAEQQSISMRSESDVSQDTETRDQRSIDSGSLYEWNDFGKNLLQEPSSLPLSRNGRLVEWIQIDEKSGLIVSNLDTVSTATSDDLLSPHYINVINMFRKLSYQIHQVLNSPLKNESKHSYEKGLDGRLSCVNEYGIMFETQQDKSTQSYWAVGRMFLTPERRQVYICYQDTCPQNIIEIAFRIALNSYL